MTALLPLLGCLLAPAAWAQSFTLVNEEAGLTGVRNHPSAWADVDGDGDPDLWDGATLWVNDGGAFTAGESLGLEGPGLFIDVDGDGLMELHIFDGGPHLLAQDGEGGWAELEDAYQGAAIGQSMAAAAGDFDGDGFLDLYLSAREGESAEAEADQRFIGLPTGGFMVDWQEPLHGVYEDSLKPGHGVSAADFDQDGDLDLFVCNERKQPNDLWRNNGVGVLDNAALELGVAGIDSGTEEGFGYSVGAAWGDLDGDGDLDLVVGNSSDGGKVQDAPQFLENLGEAGGWAFSDRADDVALVWQASYASPVIGDVDNDGDLDIFMSTVDDGDAPVLLRNEGNWQFTDVTSAAGLTRLPSSTQASFADVDGDGDLDLVAAGGLRDNDGADGHWLAVTVVGNGIDTHPMAIGTVVRIQAGALTRTRQVEVGTGAGNQQDPVLHFGLGEAETDVALDVTWPGGEVQRFEGIAVDQRITLVQCGDADGDGADDEACGGTDCDDSRPDVYPGAEEVPYDGIDQDCLGDEDSDLDGDGWAFGDGDCDDSDPDVHPDAADSWYDGIDSDCAFNSDYDADADGQDSDDYSGTDCDDNDPDIYLRAPDTAYDGIDSDCAGDSDFDSDMDGYDAVEYGGLDCDDDEIQVHPGAAEVVGNGIDENCDGVDATLGDTKGCGCGGGTAGGLWLLGLAAVWRRREV